jgi:cytochrome c biogenesis protein CcdA
MVGLVLLVASIALADSINPSTVIPALWLCRSRSSSPLASYTLGVFAVYLAGGLVLALGPGPALIATLRHVQGPVEHAVQAAGGVLALAFALVVWRSRRSDRDQPRAPRSYSRASAFALGAGIMAVELPTAFVYFGAITAILTERPAVPIEILLLVAYNALFVAPLVALAGVRLLAGDRAEVWIASGEARLRRLGQIALAGVAGAGGAALLTLGVSGLALS